MALASTAKLKPVKGIGMEGFIATWYAKNTGRSLAEFRTLAKRLEKELRAGDRVLEIAPGRFSRAIRRTYFLLKEQNGSPGRAVSRAGVMTNFG
jgi:hypothetical protein